MKELIIKNKWEYEIITENEYQNTINNTVKKGINHYGFRLLIYKNNKLFYSQGGFGAENIAFIKAEDIFLLEEMKIDINELRNEE